MKREEWIKKNASIGSEMVLFKPTPQTFSQATAALLGSSEPPLEFGAKFVACLSRTNDVQSRSPLRCKS
jgi:hypothetical protein